MRLGAGGACPVGAGARLADAPCRVRRIDEEILNAVLVSLDGGPLLEGIGLQWRYTLSRTGNVESRRAIWVDGGRTVFAPRTTKN